jgi:hypothetical protein
VLGVGAAPSGQASAVGRPRLREPWLGRLARFTSGRSDVSIAHDAGRRSDCSNGPERRFASLVDEFVGRAGVSVAGESARCGFGSSETKVNGSNFAMLSGGRLVVNLPSSRVDTLIGSTAGGPFDAGTRHHMKQRLTVAADYEETWVALARLDLPFDAEFGKPPGPYEPPLSTRSAVRGSMFTREDAVEATWRALRPLVDTGTGALPAGVVRNRQAPTTSFEAIHPGLCRGFPWWGTGRDHNAADPKSEPSTR